MWNCAHAKAISSLSWAMLNKKKKKKTQLTGPYQLTKYNGKKKRTLISQRLGIPIMYEP